MFGSARRSPAPAPARACVQERCKKQRLSLEEEAAPGGGGEAAAPRQATSGGGGGPRLVLVWDLDETLVLFNSLLMGTWAAATQRPEAVAQLAAMGRRWEAAILSLCDNHFFFDQARAQRPRILFERRHVCRGLLWLAARWHRLVGRGGRLSAQHRCSGTAGVVRSRFLLILVPERDSHPSAAVVLVRLCRWRNGTSAACRTSIATTTAAAWRGTISAATASRRRASPRTCTAPRSTLPQPAPRPHLRLQRQPPSAALAAREAASLRQTGRPWEPAPLAPPPAAAWTPHR